MANLNRRVSIYQETELGVISAAGMCGPSLWNAIQNNSALNLFPCWGPWHMLCSVLGLNSWKEIGIDPDTPVVQFSSLAIEGTILQPTLWRENQRLLPKGCENRIKRCQEDPTSLGMLILLLLKNTVNDYELWFF